MTAQDAELVRCQCCHAYTFDLVAEVCRSCGAVPLAPLHDRDADPDPRDLVRELRRAIGLFDGAMACSPREAWEEAIQEAERLFRDWAHSTQDERRLKRAARAAGLHNDGGEGA